MSDQFIPKEIMDQKGKELPEKEFNIVAEDILKFAEAIGDDNPKYCNEGYATEQFGALEAPPTFIVKMTMGLADNYKWSDFGRVGVHGGEEYEYFKPIKAGDKLVCKTKIADIYEKEGKRGKMGFMTLESSLENDAGELVAKLKRTRIRME